MTNWTKALYASLTILALSMAGGILWAAAELSATNRELRGTLHEFQGAAKVVNRIIEKNEPRINQMVTDAEVGLSDLQRAVKVQRQEWESPEYIRWRAHGLRAGEQATIAIAKFTDETLPRINSSVDSMNALITRTDQRLNDEAGVMPEAARLLVSLRQTSDAFNTDGRAILASILELTEKGETSLDAVNRVLTSPEWLSVLKSLDGAAKNIETTTAAMPGIARSVEKIAATSARYQKALLIAQLLATIGAALIP